MGAPAESSWLHLGTIEKMNNKTLSPRMAAVVVMRANATLHTRKIEAKESGRKYNISRLAKRSAVDTGRGRGGGSIAAVGALLACLQYVQNEGVGHKTRLDERT